MSLYANYVHEKTNSFILENEKGFATYMLMEDGIYIQDIYTLRDFRKQGVAAAFADEITEIAKKKGMKKLYGSIIPNNKHSTEGLKVLLAYGFSLLSATDNFIFMVKEI